MALIAEQPVTRRGGDYLFGPDARLRVQGSATARRHFSLEFGPQATPAEGEPDVIADLHFGFARNPGLRYVPGGHKTAHWRVAVSSPDEQPLRVSIVLTGGPASFALSLVQGWFVEPLVAVALARRGQLALPCAALETHIGALILMGRSGSGKSSLAMRALATGGRVLGDDQIVLDADARCWPYPRRLRVYSDLRETAPDAWVRLRPATRRALTARRAALRLSRGLVAPSLALPATEVGPPTPSGPVPAGHLIVIERGADAGELTVSECDPLWAGRRARAILDEQRARFLSVAGPGWQDAIAEVADQEVETFRAAVDGIEIDHVRLPRAWDAARAVSALEEHLAPFLI